MAWGTTLHWYGNAIRMLPNDFTMRTVYGRARDWPLTYDDLSPWYDAAEGEIGVAADVDEQCHFGVTFTPGYVYPMYPMPKSYLDQRLGAAIDGTTVRVHGADYPVGVQAIPGGRNGIPNPAYDGGRGYQPVARGRPSPPGAALRGQLELPAGVPGAGEVLGAQTVTVAEALGAQVGPRRCATSVERGPKGEIAAVHYKRWSSTGDPVPGTVTAKVYVLAAHAIENAKLLLMSEIANRSGQVGRNLMDHPFLLTWGWPERTSARSAVPGRRAASSRSAKDRSGAISPLSAPTSTTGAVDPGVTDRGRGAGGGCRVVR